MPPRSIVAVVLLVAVVSPVWSIGKTTIDPNTAERVETPSPEPLWATDKRLDAKITYEAGNARLYKVVADLARMSGVTIYCGSNPEDWRVRDIPVTVAARSVPARNLLNYLVFSTHSVLKSMKTEKGVIQYRTVGDQRVQKAIDDYEKALLEHKKVAVAWSFETATKLKDFPLSQIKPPFGSSEDWWSDTTYQIAGSRFLAALDAATKSAVLSGDVVWITPRTAPAGLRQPAIDLLKATDARFLSYLQFTNERNRKASERSGQTFTPVSALPAASTDLEDSQIRIAAGDYEVLISAGVRTSDQEWNTRNRTASASTSSMVYIEQTSNPRSIKLLVDPKYPQMPQIDFPSGDLAPFTAGMIDSEQKLTMPVDDKKPLTPADVMLAIAKTSGLTVVMEDFASHREGVDIQPSYAKDVPLERAIRDVMQDCWIDKKAGALVGSGDFWLVSHQYLVPERIINNLISKANGDGVDMEDLAPLGDFTSQAVQEWLGLKMLPGLPSRNFTEPNIRPLWSLYNSLSPADKARVKSTDGLPLSKYDTRALVRCIGDRAKTNVSRLYMSDGYESVEESLVDPKIVPSLIMRIEKNDFAYTPPAPPADKPGETAASAKVKIPVGFTKRYQYKLIIKGTDGSQTYSINLDGGYNLPYFSPEREKVLARALQQRRDAEKPANAGDSR